MDTNQENKRIFIRKILSYITTSNAEQEHMPQCDNNVLLRKKDAISLLAFAAVTSRKFPTRDIPEDKSLRNYRVVVYRLFDYRNLNGIHKQD